MSDVLANLAKSYAANKALLDQLKSKIANHKGRGNELLKQYHELSGVVSFTDRFITSQMTDNDISGYIGTTSSFTKYKDDCECFVEVTFGNSLDKEPAVNWEICTRCSSLQDMVDELENDVEDNEKVEEALREQLRKVAFREWLENPDYIFDPTKRALVAESGLLSA